MPGSNGQTEVFTIRIDSNAAKTAKEDAAELENLRKRFESTTSSLKSHEAALRRLQQGGVVNIATARELKDKIEAERNALAAMTEKVNAAGKSFEGLSVVSKKNDDKMKEARKTANELSDAFGTVLVGAILTFEASIVFATGALARFIVASRNLARAQQLAREAVTGDAEDARRLGTQVDALALKVPKARSEINDLAVELRRSGLSGQTLVDTLNAVTQASSAVGDEAGRKIQSFVDRSKLIGNFALNPFELVGTGISFQDVAATLAKQTKTSVADATTALLQGRVTLGAGAAALRETVEKKFGGVNLAKMLDLNVLKQKFGELLQTLTSGVNIEPLLEGVKDFFSLFSQSNFAGVALQKLVTVFGQGFVKVATVALPLLKGFFEGLILVALDLYIAILKLELRFKGTFNTNMFKNIDLVKTGVMAAKVAVGALAVVFGLLAAATGAALVPAVVLFGAIATVVGVVVLQVILMKKAITAVIDLFERLEAKVKALGSKDTWKNLGKNAVEGLTNPLSNIEQKGADIASKFKDGFKKALGIASPSKVFAEFGENTAEGFGGGVRRRTPLVAESLENMASLPSSPAAGANGGTVTIRIDNITIQVDGAAHHDVNALAAAIRRELQGELTRLVERGALSVGQPAAAA